MARIRFTLAQIEAFVAVVGCGSLTSASKQLGKDRTTISELIDYLELDLGYALFDGSSRSLKPTTAGHRLYRQARLFLQEADAFGQIADLVPEQIADELSVSYDPFVPRAFLRDLVSAMEARKFRLHLICQSREEAEAALHSRRADLAIYQAVNRSVGSDLKWRALGSIEMNFYAAPGYFPSGKAVSLRMLAAYPQLMLFTDMSAALAARLQISDALRTVNELEMLRYMLTEGYGWAFLPTHFCAHEWPNVEVVETEVGNRGLTHPVVALWKPGGTARSSVETLLAQVLAVWKQQ
jgi:DNA-binding transcriptional LysR family regulator